MKHVKCCRKVNLKEIERRDTLKKKLTETHDNINRATITSKELYKALKAAAPGLQKILAVNMQANTR